MNRDKGKKKPNYKLQQQPPSKPVDKSHQIGSKKSATDNETKETNNVFDKKDKNNMERNKFIRWVNRHQVWINIFLVLVGFGSYYYSWQQNNLSQENIDLMKEQFEIVNRPFIKITDIGVAEKRDSINKICHLAIKFEVNNVGNLAADVITKSVNTIAAPSNTTIEEIKQKFNYAITEDRVTISSTGGKLGDVKPAILSIPFDGYNKLKTGEYSVFFFGFVNYTSYMTKNIYTLNYAYQLAYTDTNNSINPLENVDSTNQKNFGGAWLK